MKPHVFRLRAPRRARRTAVNTGGFHRINERIVERAVARNHGPPAWIVFDESINVIGHWSIVLLPVFRIPLRRHTPGFAFKSGIFCNLIANPERSEGPWCKPLTAFGVRNMASRV
jgi:hypothetical protein